MLTRGARTAAERHRTLHAALDWSHALLQPEEQRLFRALGVFAGGFTLELAVALGLGEKMVPSMIEAQEKVNQMKIVPR